jgi:predicted transcriptional regulator
MSNNEDTYEYIVCQECGSKLQYISEAHLRCDNCTGSFEYPKEYKKHHDAPLFAPEAKDKIRSS